MKGFSLTSLVLLSLLSYACKTDTEIGKVDVSYKFFNLERAGWKSKSISHNFSDMAYTATLVPIQYYIIKNEGFENPSRIDSIYQSHKTDRVVEIEFRHDSKDDLLKSEYTRMDYESGVKYMAFSIEKDFMAVTKSGDTINCSGVTLERNFKLAPFKRLLLHFGDIPENEQIQLVYQDQLFGNGILKFKFTETPLKL
ncbi:hypothetical protein FK220_006535 [Flavobacteriaceae bacterium TP-CH-4]|uniref:Uncharacterized protein n=1 Tax=Pelagihabitans pacificus TaxID=2696054 RepID=A0A967ARK1_9FLAO|nr:hypothetical protein [Pelagihabitans pacificus]NHF58988.1 hypothetical protein [Pelagihabitans pacificus]